jgi:hypothetical protein
MSQNVLYVIIALLVVAGAALSYAYYQETKTTSGVNINVDKNGISIQKQ